MYVQRFKNLATPGSLLSATLVGLVSLSAGCSAEMADCIVKCKSELHAFSEHGSHLISAISDEGIKEIDIESEAAESTENQAAPASEISPSSEDVKNETTKIDAESEVAVTQKAAEPAKANEALNGELGEKEFQEPGTLEKPAKLLPDGRPEWTLSKDKITGKVDMLVVSTQKYGSREESLSNLPQRAYERFTGYSKQTLGFDVKEFKEITPEWVAKRFIKDKDSEFVAEVIEDDTAIYMAWAKLDINAEATRGELEDMYRKSQSYPRLLKVVSYMLSAIAFFGLAHVGFNLISSVQPKKK